jgi:hypothetical protein
MALEREFETYKRRLPELAGSEGKFALVHGDDLDVFTSYEDAAKEGYRRYGLTPFMVKRIQAIEQVQQITRLLVPQPA